MPLFSAAKFGLTCRGSSRAHLGGMAMRRRHLRASHCVWALLPALGSAQDVCSCASAPADPEDLQYCRSTGDPHYETFSGAKFDFMGTGVFQLLGAESDCACASVEVQTFMCNSDARWKGASTNAAVAVNVGGTTLTINATDDVVLVTGAHADTVAPSDATESHTFGYAVLERELMSNKWGWRIRFPAGGSLLSARVPVPALPHGALLNIWAELPTESAGQGTSGLCTKPCKRGLPPAPCGPFTADVSLAGLFDVGSFGDPVDDPWTCSNMCWNDHGGDAFFSHSLDGACSCQSANTDANSNSGTTSGRACMQPCAYVDSGDGHCVHVATSASLFDDATCELPLEHVVLRNSTLCILLLLVSYAPGGRSSRPRATYLPRRAPTRSRRAARSQ